MRDLQIDTIIFTVSDYYGEDLDVMMSSKKHRHAKMRHVAMYVARDLTEFSYEDLGEVFGFDHSAVSRAVRAIEETDPLSRHGLKLYAAINAVKARMQPVLSPWKAEPVFKTTRKEAA